MITWGAVPGAMSAPLGITFMAVKVVLLVKIGAGRLSLTLMMVVLVYSMQRVLLMGWYC